MLGVELRSTPFSSRQIIAMLRFLYDCRGCELISNASPPNLSNHTKKAMFAHRFSICSRLPRELGYPDSNQERQDQNLQCYHYTIAQSHVKRHKGKDFL